MFNPEFAVPLVFWERIMGAVENKQLFQEIFAGLAVGDGRHFIDSLADDFCWTITGTTAWSGTYRGKEDVRAKLLRPLFEQFANRYTNALHRIVAEGDYVVIECRGKVTTKTGKPYNNTYCWVCRVADGKLTELTEYMDTELVATVLLPPRTA
jgi:ketosteroid isomerase-like protein